MVQHRPVAVPDQNICCRNNRRHNEPSPCQRFCRGSKQPLLPDALIFTLDNTDPARLIVLRWVVNPYEASHHLRSDDLWRCHTPHAARLFELTRRGKCLGTIAYDSLGRCVLPALACLSVIAFGLGRWGIWKHYSEIAIGGHGTESFFGCVARCDTLEIMAVGQKITQ